MAPALSPRPIKLTFSRDQWNRLKESTRTDLLSRAVDEPERSRAYVSFHVSKCGLPLIGQACLDLAADQNLDIDFWDGTADVVAFRHAQAAAATVAKLPRAHVPAIAAVPPAVEAEIVEADMATIDDVDDQVDESPMPSEAEILAAIDFHKTVDQNLKGGR